ncbi:myosin-9-like isoform X1 [Lates japonicus]|uniref:Myosin-9-like isoform X1 n=1 Tax=Lates japonicus TaxID=270547 RepID=A0AAD3NMA4_LATJO|nr:myosin-9-like isoform X1 [Lates japonicus]
MEGCLNEGKLAEEKIRSMAMELETEVAELRKNLQQAVNQKLKAEREKKRCTGPDGRTPVGARRYTV